MSEKKQAPQEPRATVFCDTCDQRAYRRVGERNICRECEEREHREKSSIFCHARGLNSAAEMRAYCMRLAKSFSQPSFELWCKNMTQRTVDLIAINGGPSDERCLERLRAAGVIDGGNRLIPLEARPIAAEAYRAERARIICQAEEAMQAREPGED